MKKDVIYIDIEDDITSIIEKVKAASATIVALVPPKRIGVLQSVVNMKLLQRAANATDKRVVIITNDQSLSALAAGVQIPVAKNLQSKPELAPIAALDIDDEEIINGSELPIGDHAASAPVVPTTSSKDKEQELLASLPLIDSTQPVVDNSSRANTPKKAKKGLSVPNFESFRKKLFIGIAVAILLIGLGVWAFVFAPKATITITAQTTPYDLSKVLTLQSNATLNASSGTLAYEQQQIKKSNSIEFTATGKKDVGQKASGSMTLTRDGVSDTSSTVPAGTGFSSGNYTYVSTSDVTIPRSSISGNRLDRGTATVSVVAADIGEEYNISARSYQPTVSGYSADGSDMSGGSKKTVTVVSQDDVTKAQEQLKSQGASDVQNDLKKQFDNDAIVITESYSAATADPTVNPAVGSEATKASISAETTYTLLAVNRSDLTKVLDEETKNQLEDKTQKIYDSGLDDLRFSDFTQNASGFTTRVIGKSYAGPEIDAEALKQQLTGKRAGQVEATLRTIDGVKSVETTFSPFWVSTTPSPDKITVNFKVENGNN